MLNSRERTQQMFTSFSGISFLYTCNAVVLLLVVEIKLKEEYFMLTQKASDTWRQCSFFKSRAFRKYLQNATRREISHFFCFKALFCLMKIRNMEKTFRCETQQWITGLTTNTYVCKYGFGGDERLLRELQQTCLQLMRNTCEFTSSQYESF